MTSEEQIIADTIQSGDADTSRTQEASDQRVGYSADSSGDSTEPSVLSGQPSANQGLSDQAEDGLPTTPLADGAVHIDAHQDGAIDQAVVEQLKQEVNSLKAQLEERMNLYVRLQADFDNFRKRTQKEKEELDVQVKCSTISELLPVIDNFDRARSQLKPQTEEGNNIHKSYQGVYKQLVDCLKRIGVSPMRSEGKEFDPNLHEAVIREPTDQYPEGTVIEELVRGYVLGEKVLRHAMVKVSTSPESEGSIDGQA